MSTAVLPSEPEMFRALVERDSSYEGIFFVGVTTTGIFCRPTCPARKPRRENVEYFASSGDALHAGYRPCRRCRPLEEGEAPPAWVERLHDAIERDPARRLKDADLRAMSVDPARVRRYFKQRYGMTFHAYHRARRMGLALAEVRQPAPSASRRSGARKTIDAIGFEHGYESTSGFREAFSRLFGEPPGRGTTCACLLARWLDTPLGAMLAISADEGLCLLEFVDRRALEREIGDLRRQYRAVIVPGDNNHLARIAAEIDEYFAGARRTFSVPLATHGSAFQREVWDELRRIPYGVTRSYAEMAANIGRPGAYRAVGRANGENRLAIVIPCHRVIRADGTLCGYGGGLWRKRRLIELEITSARESAGRALKTASAPTYAAGRPRKGRSAST